MEWIATLGPALGVIAGGLITGFFNWKGQAMSQRAEEARALREADERERTRFHEVRRELYADFLAAVNDALGRLSHDAIERQRASGHVSHTPEGVSLPFRQLEGQFGPDAPMRMTRQQAIVSMISGSLDVRAASKELAHSVIEFTLIEPDPDNAAWSRSFVEALNQQRKAYERFVDLANAELTGSRRLPGEDGRPQILGDERP